MLAHCKIVDVSVCASQAAARKAQPLWQQLGFQAKIYERKKTNKQANKENMRRRQGESSESQWANKKKAKQRQGLRKEPVTKTNTQRKYKNKEKMRRRQGESCESQRANKKKAKQLQGEEIKKRASNKDKHTTKIQTRRR